MNTLRLVRATMANDPSLTWTMQLRGAPDRTSGVGSLVIGLDCSASAGNVGCATGEWTVGS